MPDQSPSAPNQTSVQLRPLGEGPVIFETVTIRVMKDGRMQATHARYDQQSARMVFTQLCQPTPHGLDREGIAQNLVDAAQEVLLDRQMQLGLW